MAAENIMRQVVQSDLFGMVSSRDLLERLVVGDLQLDTKVTA